MRKGKEPEPLIHGGGQEQGLRSGTLVADAVRRVRRSGEARATNVAHATMTTFRSCGRPRSRNWAMAGSSMGASQHRYPGNLNIRREGVDAARLIADLRDIAFSLGSACASGSGRPSHVLRALGLDYREARSSIRLGFGRYTQAARAGRGLRQDCTHCGRAGEARRVTLVRFLRADGSLDKEVEAAAGQRLLDVAWAAREPLEGGVRRRDGLLDAVT